MSFEVTELAPRLGSRVHTDIDTLLSGKHADRIRELLEERGVLLFRGIEMDDQQQLAFTKTIGPTFNPGTDDIYKVSLDKAINPTHYYYNYGNFCWHIDRTDQDVPPFSTILRAAALAPQGGQTEFANTYAAYEDLPEADKQLIEDLKVVHSVEASIVPNLPDAPQEVLEQFRKHPDKVHPLVWRHRSGRKSLITSTSGAEVVGMDKDAGQALLKRLMEWATQPQYTYLHEWQLGDFVMWDNTGVMHRVKQYDITSGRVMHRTTILGDEPFDPRREALAA